MLMLMLMLMLVLVLVPVPVLVLANMVADVQILETLQVLIEVEDKH
jgi:hypothetical protein